MHYVDGFFRSSLYERGVILSKTRLVVFLEPTQIYRFLRTRNLIAVSEYSTHLYLNLTALNCWWKMTDIRPPSFFSFLSPYFCTGHSPSCLTEMVEQMPEGMESGETGILLFFPFFFVITMHCHSWLKMICSWRCLWTNVLWLLSRKTFKVDDMLQTVVKMKGEQDSPR